MLFTVEDHFEKLSRLHSELIRKSDEIANEVEIGNNEVADLASSYFIQSFSLRDYLKKDSRVSRPKKIDQLIKTSKSLSIVADLANSYKHGGLDSKPKSELSLTGINMAYTLDLPISGKHIGTINAKQNFRDGDTLTISVSERTGTPIATAKLFYRFENEIQDAVKLAKDSYDEWKQILKQYSIKLD